MNARLSKYVVSVVLIVTLALAIAPFAGAQEGGAPDYWPTEGWRTSTPEEQGMDSEKLVAMLEWLERGGTKFHSILVIRNGYVVLDASTFPFSTSQSHWMSGLACSTVSTLTGIAIDQGYIESVDQSIWDFFSKETTANMEPRKEAITLEHLLTGTAGLQPDNRLEMYKLTEDDQSWVQFALDRSAYAAPGERFGMSDPDAHLVSAIIQQTTGMSTAEYAQQNLFDPLGFTDVTWWADPQGVNQGCDGVAWSASDAAKLGYLYLHQGEWDGQQIVSSDWIQTATSPLVDLSYLNYFWGYLWLRNRCGISHEYPCNLMMGIGTSLWIVPDLDLITVVTGYYDDPRLTMIGLYVVPAVQSDVPLPANPAAQGALQARVDAFANPAPVAIPAPPDIQAQISGQTYALNENGLGWTSLAITFGEQEALLTLEVQGRRLELPVGLDGVFRISTVGLPDDVSNFRPVPDVPLALKGEWKGEAFVITARDLLGALNGQFSLIFRDTLRVSITGDAGLQRYLSMTGTPQ